MESWKQLCTVDGWESMSVILFQHPENKSIFGIHAQNGLIKYSPDKDCWDKVDTANKLPSNFFLQSSGSCLSKFHPTCINPKTNTIYILNQRGSLATLQLNADDKSKWEFIHGFDQIGHGSKGIMIHGQFHVIGGIRKFRNSKHLKYNQQTKKFDVLHDFKKSMNWDDFQCHEVVKIKNRLLMLGGTGDSEQINLPYSAELYRIREYDMNGNKWKVSDVQMPKKWLLTAVSVIYDQYVLIFGGRYEVDWDYSLDSDAIWIYLPQNKSFLISNIKCPKRSMFGYNAMVVNDREMDEKIVYGFVRKQWKSANIKDHLFPPNYLLKLMLAYYLNEFVHLFSQDGHHWKINVFDIIKNCKPLIFS